LKGRLEKIHEEMSLATKKFDKISEEIFPLRSPLLEVERHLVKIKRQKAPNNK
jgi:16S rRNA (guanine527-N7)-methyltransferase